MTTKTGIDLFNSADDIQRFQLIEMLRSWAYSWDRIDEHFNVGRGRSRRVYKRICTRYGIVDRHPYRHCQAL